MGPASGRLFSSASKDLIRWGKLREKSHVWYLCKSFFTKIESKSAKASLNPGKIMTDDHLCNQRGELEFNPKRKEFLHVESKLNEKKQWPSGWHLSVRQIGWKKASICKEGVKMSGQERKHVT